MSAFWTAIVAFFGKLLASILPVLIAEGKKPRDATIAGYSDKLDGALDQDIAKEAVNGKK